MQQLFLAKAHKHSTSKKAAYNCKPFYRGLCAKIAFAVQCDCAELKEGMESPFS